MILASGGTISIVNGYKIHTFTGNGTFTVITGGNVEALVVAGGGAGGGVYHGAGGGGGGVLYEAAYAVTAQAYTITVGNGGVGASAAKGTSGGNSVFDTLTAQGGGAGGREGATSGSNGGCGGGAYGGTKGTGVVGPPRQGYDGGTKGSGFGSGGGGGSAAVGGDGAGSTTGGEGGAGVSSEILGIHAHFGGGGGGACYSGTGGTGGEGGGGSGGNSTSQAPLSGTAYTGGGGGGCERYGAVQAGGNGGSGIVIIRYPTSETGLLYRVDAMEALIRTVLREPSQTMLTFEDILHAINDGYKDVALKAFCVECEHIVNTINGSRLVPFNGHRVNQVIPALGGDASSTCAGCGVSADPCPEWPCGCEGAHIDYTSQQIFINGTQTLTVGNPAAGETYTWAVSGGGSVSPSTGTTTVYTAPASNPNCGLNSIVTLLLGEKLCSSVEIAVTAVNQGTAGMVDCSVPFPEHSSLGIGVHCENTFVCSGAWTYNEGPNGFCAQHCQAIGVGFGGYNPTPPEDNLFFHDQRSAEMLAYGCCPWQLM